MYVEEIDSLADLSVRPSVRDRDGNVDGLPTVVVEAMAAGLPVVASDLAGIPWVVRHGDHGLLTPPGQPEPLAQALLHLLDNPAERERMGQRARQRVEEEFTWRAIAVRFSEILESVRVGSGYTTEDTESTEKGTPLTTLSSLRPPRSRR